MDFFSRGGNVFAGSFAADAARVTFAAGSSTEAGANGAGLITQSVNIQYSQNVMRVYEVGSQNTYFIGGRTQGQSSTQQILGPRPIQLAFYRKYANVCNAASNILNFEADANCVSGDVPAGQRTSNGGLMRFVTRNCVIVSIQLSTQAADMVINTAIGYMFISLELLT